MSHLGAVSTAFSKEIASPGPAAYEELVVEKRGHPRATIDAQLICSRPDGTRFEALGKDISMGGMYIEATEAVVFGEQLSIQLTLSGARTAMSLPAVVRWTDPGGFGVQFGLLGARETHAISQLIRR